MVEVNLDEKDFEILKQLDWEGDIDVEKLAEELDNSKSTVYYRLVKYSKQELRVSPATIVLREDIARTMLLKKVLW